MKKLIPNTAAFLVCLILCAGCSPVITISSPNEPQSDAEALTLAGITMTPPPQVEHMHFTAGMDDQMDLVIRFPNEQLDNFWAGSKWAREDAIVLSEESTTMRETHRKYIEGIGFDKYDAVLKSLRETYDGIWCEEPAGSSEGLKVLLSFDQDENDVVAYIEWFQT